MNCKNLIITAFDIPNLEYTKDLSKMFYKCTSLNADLSNWNTSNITDMNNMFQGCKSFNSDLSKWNTSNVTNMSGYVL